MSVHAFERLYRELLAFHGRQGWWPIPSSAGRPGFDERGYHPGDFRGPQSAHDTFEVIMGAVLTQNTAWTNVEMALSALRSAGITAARRVRDADAQLLASLIHSSGYHDQKARKLKIVATLFAARGALESGKAPSREDLLALWGIGPETADAILLYAFQKPVFVIDAYTRRLISRVGLIEGKESYDGLQSLFHAALPRDHAQFNEYHALIVQHSKTLCRARPVCASCPVSRCASRRDGPP